MIYADQNGVVTTAATSQFMALSGAFVLSSTETDLQMVIRDAGTYHGMFIRIRSNSSTGTNTLTFRKNAGNGNQTVNPAGAAGNFQDTTHTDAVVATDKVDINSSADSTLTMTLEVNAIMFDSTTNFSTRQATTTSTAYTTGNDFNVICGLQANNASNEAGVLTKAQKAATMAHMQCNVTAFAKTASMTVVSRKNSGAGAMTVTVGGTGISEDSTHSDSLAVNDTWENEFVAGTDTTHAVTFSLMAQDHETSTGNIFLVQAGASADVTGVAAATRTVNVGGRYSLGSTENNLKCNALASFTYSNMTIHQTVTSSPTGTTTFRKNVLNANQTITWGTAVGTYTDSTHSDAVISTDTVNYQNVYAATTAGGHSKCFVYGNFVTNAGFARNFGISEGSEVYGRRSHALSTSFGNEPPIFG